MKREHLTIGQVADQAGVNAQTLRYYERRGILGRPRRTSAGYRSYPVETVRVIRFIKRAQELGFTLDEIDELLAFRRVSARKREAVRTLAAAKIDSVRRKIDHLQAIERALRQLVDACACEAGEAGCPILEALEDDGPRRLHVVS